MPNKTNDEQMTNQREIEHLVTEAFHACRFHQSYLSKPDYHISRAERFLEKIIELMSSHPERCELDEDKVTDVLNEVHFHIVNKMLAKAICTHFTAPKIKLPCLDEIKYTIMNVSYCEPRKPSGVRIICDLDVLASAIHARLNACLSTDEQDRKERR